MHWQFFFIIFLLLVCRTSTCSGFRLQWENGSRPQRSALIIYIFFELAYPPEGAVAAIRERFVLAGPDYICNSLARCRPERQQKTLEKWNVEREWESEGGGWVGGRLMLISLKQRGGSLTCLPLHSYTLQPRGGDSCVPEEVAAPRCLLVMFASFRSLTHSSGVVGWDWSGVMRGQLGEAQHLQTP